MCSSGYISLIVHVREGLDGSVEYTIHDDMFFGFGSTLVMSSSSSASYSLFK